MYKYFVLLLSLILASCSGSDGQEKISFSLYCKKLGTISTISPIIGVDRIDTVCACGYTETLKSISQSEMKKAMSTGAGTIDIDVGKFLKASQLAIASCLQNLDVPENAKKLTSSFAEGLKEQVNVQLKMLELMSK